MQIFNNIRIFIASTLNAIHHLLNENDVETAEIINESKFNSELSSKVIKMKEKARICKFHREKKMEIRRC